VSENQAHNLTNIKIFDYDSNQQESPMILHPEDRIILGVANQPLPSLDPLSPATLEDYIRNEHACATVFRTKLSPGIGRVTFYGSYLRDGQPLPPETSQPITSVAVHEDVRDDSSPSGNAKCLDQFLVEPPLSYSGSYLDTKLYDIYRSTLGIVSVSAGLNHNLFLTLDGKVYSLGENYQGELGLGYFQQSGEPSASELQLISFFSDRNIQIKEIVAGSNCSFAIDTEGNGWSWGLNQNLQLGLNDSSATSKYSLPQPILRCEYRHRVNQSFNPLASESTLVTNTIVPKFKKISRKKVL
jgi:hypothetical protein